MGVRRRGYPNLMLKVAAFEEAEQIDLDTAAGQSCGQFVDYASSRQRHAAQFTNGA